MGQSFDKMKFPDGFNTCCLEKVPQLHELITAKVTPLRKAESETVDEFITRLQKIIFDLDEEAYYLSKELRDRIAYYNIDQEANWDIMHLSSEEFENKYTTEFIGKRREEYLYLESDDNLHSENNNKES